MDIQNVPKPAKQSEPQRLAPPATTKQPKKKKGHKGLIIVAVIIVAFVLIEILISTTDKNAAKQQAATASNTPTTAQQVANWDTQYGSSITNIVSDFGSVGKDANNPTALAVDCQKIADDVTTAQGQPPIPDSTTQSDWSSALTSFASAAKNCSNGLANNDSSMISQATTEFTQGDNSLDAATSSIQSLE